MARSTVLTSSARAWRSDQRCRACSVHKFAPYLHLYYITPPVCEVCSDCRAANMTEDWVRVASNVWATSLINTSSCMQLHPHIVEGVWSCTCRSCQLSAAS